MHAWSRMTTHVASRLVIPALLIAIFCPFLFCLSTFADTLGGYAGKYPSRCSFFRFVLWMRECPLPAQVQGKGTVGILLTNSIMNSPSTTQHCKRNDRMAVSIQRATRVTW